MAVRCRGRLTLYEARGKFQMSVVDDRADGRRRAGARLRAAQAAARRRGAVRSRRASGRCRSCRAGSAWSRRRRARSSATSSASRTAASRSRSCSRPRRCRAKAPRWAIAAGHPQAGGDRRRRRHHRRARRRLARGSVGVQRGAGRARDLRLPRAGDLRGRPRDRLHDRRLRRRPARADAVGRGRARGPDARRPGRGAGAAAAPRRPRAGRDGAPRPPRAGTRAGAPRRSAPPARRAAAAPGRAGRARAGACWRAGWRRRAPTCARVEVRLHRAHPHRRIAEQRHALAAMRHRLETAVQPALVPAAPRDRGGVRQAGGAVADARARARLQPHPARRRPRRHQRRRRAAGRAHHRPRAATAASTRPSTGRARNDPRRRCWAPTSARAARPRSTTPRSARWASRASTARSPSSRGGFDALVADLRAQGYRYLNVTIPHKAAAFATGRRARPRGARVGRGEHAAVRAAAGIRGENTDGAGLLAALADLGVARGRQRRRDGGRGRRRRRRGRGAHARRRGGPPDRAPAGDRGRSCARGCRRAQRDRVTGDAWTGDGLARALDGATVLVSAVPAAAWADADDRAPGSTTLAGGAAVLEMAYGAETPLAVAARARGARYADGLGMLVHQAAHAITLALGKTPPLAPLFEAVQVPARLTETAPVHPVPRPRRSRSTASRCCACSRPASRSCSSSWC